MAAVIRVGDIGTIIESTLYDQNSAVLDVSSAAVTKNFRFLKPDGSTVVKAASFVTDGTDGKLKYALIAGDSDISGDWMYQAEVVITAGTFTSDSSSFRIYPKEIS